MAKNEPEPINEEDAADNPRSQPSTYECARCDEEFTRTDEQIEDEDQSTEYCDACLELMADSGKGEDDDEEEAV